MKHAVEKNKARREIRDANSAALGVRQNGRDNCGISLVIALGPDLVVQHDVRVALVLVAGEQAREHRISVEARKAPPDDPTVTVDQGSDAPVADDAVFET